MRPARDLIRSIDPATIATEVGLVLDPWQADVIRSPSKRQLLLCSRQSGKSTAASIMAIGQAVTSPRSLTLLVSPSLRQSAELFRTVMGYFRKLPDAPKILSESVTRLELVTGSRIVSLPGTEGTIRGYAAASLIVVDEAARVTDELMVACRPMLATSGGRLVAVSTPAPGRSGWFFHAWHGPENWNRVRVPADQCPRISKEFLDEEMRVLGPLQFGQEYMLEWQDNEEGVFALEMFDRCASDQVEWLTCLT